MGDYLHCIQGWVMHPVWAVEFPCWSWTLGGNRLLNRLQAFIASFLTVSVTGQITADLRASPR